MISCHKTGVIEMTTTTKKLKKAKQKVVRTDGQTFFHNTADLPGNLCVPLDLARLVKKAIPDVLVQGVHTNYYAGLAAVGGGSAHISQLVHLPNKDAEIVFIGKGITFDSGGISIKGAHNMMDMKFDKTGAVTVASAAIDALAGKHKPFGVVLPIAENMLGTAASRPGDVITYSNGLRIEIENTDAEGRLILADGILHALKVYPKAHTFITVATLTGAIGYCLGDHYTGLFSDSDRLTDRLLEAANKTKVPVWLMPLLFEESKKAYKSSYKHADYMNSAKGKVPGASSAASFMKLFLPPHMRFAHFDIASTAYKNGKPLENIMPLLVKIMKEGLK
jgi:leucyl aminopeptidase